MGTQIALALSLLAAVCYGVCHFVNGVLSRRASGLAIGALAQIGGTLIVLPAVPLYPASHVSPAALGWGALSGVGSAGLAFLYRGMERGQISVVEPVSELTASALPVGFGIAIGQALSPASVAGIAVTFPALWLASRTRRPAGPGGRRLRPAGGAGMASGILDGLTGGAGVALTWIALSRASPAAGLWPLALSRAVSLAIMLVIAWRMRAPLRVSRPTLLVAYVAGAIGTVATGLYMFAARAEPIAVASVITGFYPLIPVVAAVLFVKERLGVPQLAGLVLAGAAIVLLAL
ncbi:MAG: DMT family transporter [Nocardiopsaceae bacterium]|nr:DMT family transporter [Nocardiopsaceae bacterium]